MSSNDPRKNIDNLLFRPNNSIDDEQPAFFFYSQPETPPNTSNTLGDTAQVNPQQDTSGPNNNFYQTSNIIPANIWNSGRGQSNPPPVLDNLGQTPPKQVTTAPPPSVLLFPPTGIFPRSTTNQFSNLGISSQQSVPESVLIPPKQVNPPPSVPLFPPTGIYPKATTNQFSNVGISSNQAVPEPVLLPSKQVFVRPPPSIPLFAPNQFSNAGTLTPESVLTPPKQVSTSSVPRFPPSGISPNLAANQYPNAGLSYKQSAPESVSSGITSEPVPSITSCFTPEVSFKTSTTTFPASVPLFPPSGEPPKSVAAEPVPSVILFSNTGRLNPIVPEPALTISTFTGTSSKPTVSEVQSTPAASSFPKSTPIAPSSSNPLAAFFSSEDTFVKPAPIDSPQSVPLFPADSGPSIPFFSARRTPPQSIVSELIEDIYKPTASVPLFPPSGVQSGPGATETVTSIPLFSPGDLSSRPNLTQAPSTGSTNTYRRAGSKRPVYARIPGIQNTSQQAQVGGHQFQQQHSSLADYFTPPSSQPILQKHINQSDSSQANSPFLSPVAEPPALSSVDERVSRHSPRLLYPEMAASDAQIATGSNYMFSNDGRLPVVEASSDTYKSPYYHWFYKKDVDGRVIWEPFTRNDSVNLENNFTSVNLTPEQNIPTDGGRFDVNILRRQRTSVYWNSKPSEVRRCSWYHKSHMDSKHVPFEENIATKLEEEYKSAVESNVWPRKVDLPSGESVMLHTPDVLVLFSNSQPTISLDNSTQDGPLKPRVVKRGIDESSIDEGESEEIDHLLFMVHGIGPGCDLKFRSVEEVVDDFRSVALQLVRTHYRSSSDQKIVHRVEMLPISWHHKLHSEDTGIDNKMKSITLDSIPKLREFTNDTLLDILFYTSPFYGQTIISSVGSELNRIYDLFKQRNPNFKGGISLAGHSLGSLILFDILCNQVSIQKDVEQTSDEEEDEVPLSNTKPHPLNRKMSRRISYMVGNKGTGQAQVNYPTLNFQPAAFFALGSPIGMFVTIRGLDNLGEKFVLPTCPGFFNIFHPYDPVAYRIEALVNPQLANVKPVLIPHHKGRKRMHLELKETMAKVGSDLKQKLVDSMKSTWNSLLGWSSTRPSMQPTIAEEVDKVLEQFANKHSNQNGSDDQSSNEATGINLGMLNNGRRIDYVLQEAPVEFFNEYIFALSSHVCYWESEDTVLLILKEIYNLLNVSPDCQIPQQTMTIERPLPASKTPDHVQNQPVKVGVDPTAPMKRETNVGPPPLSGFVKNS